MARLLPQPGVTLVRQVADHVRDRITRDQLKRGAPLPSYRDLADELDVASWTVKRGIDELVAEGVVLQQHGRGVFVAKELSAAPRPLKHLGIIFPGSRASLFRSQYLTEVMRGITWNETNCPQLYFFSLRQDGLVCAAQLGEWAIDGAILIGVENDDYLRAFTQWGTPFVVADYCARAVPVDYVACDNHAAARRIVAHLAAVGRRRVTYVTSLPQQEVSRPGQSSQTLLVRDSSDVRERQVESLKALDEAGLVTGVWTRPADSLPQPWADLTAERVLGLRHHPDRPTAVLACDNYSAVRLIAAFEERGVRVPADISVASVASDGNTPFGGPVLTCCRFDFVGMGRMAHAILEKKCRKPGLKTSCEHRIGFEFVEGQTVSRVTPA